jgi:transposase
MKHVDMRKLPAAAQEERRRQVIGLRQAGQTYDAIAAQVGLSPTGVFDICKRYAEQGAAGLKTGPRGPEPGYGRFLDAEQEAATRDLIRRHTPDELDLPFALWSRAAVRGHRQLASHAVVAQTYQRRRAAEFRLRRQPR